MPWLRARGSGRGGGGGRARPHCGCYTPEMGTQTSDPSTGRGGGGRERRFERIRERRVKGRRRGAPISRLKASRQGGGREALVERRLRRALDVSE
jgi:hypothetical protein